MAPSTRRSACCNKYGEDAKVLAGGQSLIPLMRLRLSQPSALVDINALDRELDHIRRDNGTRARSAR